MTLHAGLEFDFPPSTHARWTNDNIIHGVIEQATYGTEFRGTIVDIGANVGAFTCLAAKTAAYVRSFEPDPENFGYLTDNVARNEKVFPGGGKGMVIELHNAGVGTPGRRQFYRNSINCGSFSLIPHDNWTDPPITVEIVSLAEALKGLDHVDLLKIDCEGAEWEFLTPDADLSRVERIAMELHLHEGGRSVEDMQRLLSDHGFSTGTRRANVTTAVTLFAQRK